MAIDYSDFSSFPSDWEIKTIKEFAKVRGGKRLPLGKSLTANKTPHPYIRIVDFKDGRVDKSNLLYVPEDVFPEISKYTISKKDIYISIVGTIGLVGVIDEELDGANLTENAAKICEIDDSVDRTFLAAYLQSGFGQHEIMIQTVGSTQPKLALFRIGDIRVPIPPLPEQRAIAGILGALDDKIELNRRMNRTLEAMARAVFRHWFVESEEVASWKVGKLGDVCESTIGGDWGEENEFEDSVPVICLRGVDLDNLRRDGYSENAPLRWVRKSSLEKRQLSDCDVLIAGSGIGPVGKSLWVSPEMLKAYSYPVIYSNFVKRFRAKSPEYAVYIDRVLFNMRESNEIWDYVNGTSIPNLDDKGLLEYADIVIPPEKKVKAFYEYVKPIYAKLYNKESRTLARLRDALLPKLMRGEVRVRGWDNS